MRATRKTSRKMLQARARQTSFWVIGPRKRAIANYFKRRL